MKELTVGTLLTMTAREIMGLTWHQNQIKAADWAYELIAYKKDDSQSVLEEAYKHLKHLKRVLKVLEKQKAIKINLFPFKDDNYIAGIGTYDRKVDLQKEIDLYYPNQYEAESWKSMLNKQIKAVKKIKKLYDRTIYLPVMED